MNPVSEFLHTRTWWWFPDYKSQLIRVYDHLLQEYRLVQPISDLYQVKIIII